MNARDKGAFPPIPFASLVDPRNVEPLAGFEGKALEATTQMKDFAAYWRDMMKLASQHAGVNQKGATEFARRQTQAAQAVSAALARQRPGDLPSYLVDYAQRWIIFLDVLRQRGNNFIDHMAEGCPPVLAYEFDVVVDGSTLERPVNYSLVSIRPPAGTQVRQNARPYVIIDPRAGHGSGIGGFKDESEVGVSLRGGHPVYFCIFTTHPTKTQTLADVTRAEAHFIREVQHRHPNSPKPVIVGNCQGGWAAMLLAATNPDLTGPIVVNGAPLSYWAGTRGKNPMRYLGGLFGGIFPALLMSDLGNGQFDGANLVSNFEALNPGNAMWMKYYDVFKDPEHEAQRYLEFERWWSGFYFMNEKEIRWIVENLFVGNKLARGGAQLDSRMHVDLRNIRAPIIVFASHGDNITPPPQALNWIADCYSSVKDIQARGQRILYTVHPSVGHLGIFVSSSVAKKEHREIVSTLKAIEALAPGLYEMKIVEEHGGGLDKEFTVSFEDRTIEDILEMDDDDDDEKAFAAVSRLSELGAEVYDLTTRPLVKAMSNPVTARWNADSQSIRSQRYFFSDQNPAMAPVAAMAAAARDNRMPAPEANPFKAWEKAAVEVSADWINLARDMRDGFCEQYFYGVWNTPWMRTIGSALLPRISQVPGTDLRAVPEVRSALAQMSRGNFAVAVIRMLLLLAASRTSVRRDRLERSNELLTKHEPFASLGEETRTRIIHQQNLIVEFEPEGALATLPKLLPRAEDRPHAIEHCRYVIGNDEEMAPETREVLDKIRMVLEIHEPEGPARGPEPERPRAALPAKAKAVRAKAPANPRRTRRAVQTH